MCAMVEASFGLALLLGATLLAAPAEGAREYWSNGGEEELLASYVESCREELRDIIDSKTELPDFSQLASSEDYAYQTALSEQDVRLFQALRTGLNYEVGGTLDFDENGVLKQIGMIFGSSKALAPIGKNSRVLWHVHPELSDSSGYEDRYTSPPSEDDLSESIRAVRGGSRDTSVVFSREGCYVYHPWQALIDRLVPAADEGLPFMMHIDIQSLRMLLGYATSNLYGMTWNEPKVTLDEYLGAMRDIGFNIRLHQPGEAVVLPAASPPGLQLKHRGKDIFAEAKDLDLDMELAARRSDPDLHSARTLHRQSLVLPPRRCWPLQKLAEHYDTIVRGVMHFGELSERRGPSLEEQPLVLREVVMVLPGQSDDHTSVDSISRSFPVRWQTSPAGAVMTAQELRMVAAMALRGFRRATSVPTHIVFLPDGAVVVQPDMDKLLNLVSWITHDLWETLGRPIRDIFSCIKFAGGGSTIALEALSYREGSRRVEARVQVHPPSSEAAGGDGGPGSHGLEDEEEATKVYLPRDGSAGFPVDCITGERLP